jgi:hypothetical protein
MEHPKFCLEGMSSNPTRWVGPPRLICNTFKLRGARSWEQRVRAAVVMRRDGVMRGCAVQGISAYGAPQVLSRGPFEQSSPLGRILYTDMQDLQGLGSSKMGTEVAVVMRRDGVVRRRAAQSMSAYEAPEVLSRGHVKQSHPLGRSPKAYMQHFQALRSLKLGTEVPQRWVRCGT